MANLKKISKLKARKLDQAQLALHKASRELQSVREQLARKQNECEAYRAWRIKEVDAAYEGLKNKILTLAQLDQARTRIASMYAHESSLRECVLALQKKVNDAEQQKTRCLMAVKKAEKDVDKFDELIALSVQEENILQERNSENLLDEFASASLERSKHADAATTYH